MRSFSGVIAAVEKTIGRPRLTQNIPSTYTMDQKGRKFDRYGNQIKGDPEIDTQVESLVKSIKKDACRIDKLKKLIRGPETPGNAEMYADIRRKIQRAETYMNRAIMKLKQRQGEKLKNDERELTKLRNRQKDFNNEIVRLEDGKIRDRKKDTPVFVPHRNDRNGIVRENLSNRSDTFNPQVKDHKKSTSKNQVYKSYDREKAEEEFQALLDGTKT